MNDLLHQDEMYETGEPPRTQRSEIDMLPRTKEGAKKAAAHRMHTFERLDSSYCVSPEEFLIAQEEEKDDDDDLEAALDRVSALTREETGVAVQSDSLEPDPEEYAGEFAGQTGERAFKFGAPGLKDSHGGQVSRDFRTRNAGPLSDTGRRSARTFLRGLRDF